MAEDQHQVQSCGLRQEHHGRTAVGRLPAVHRPDQPDHAKPQLAKGMPGQLETGRRRVHRSGTAERHLLQGRRSASPTAGDRYAHLAERHPEHHTLHAGHVHRAVERPEPQTQTVHADAHTRRAGAQHRPDRVRGLLLRAAHGSRGTRRVDPVVRYRLAARTVPGRVRLRGRHKLGKRVTGLTITPEPSS